MYGLLSNTLDALLALQQGVDFAKEQDYFGMNTTSRGVYPPVNFFEKDGGLVLLAELPGVKKDDVNLEVKDNLLRIQGERKVDYGEGISYHRRERGNFKFDRSLKLPFRVDDEHIKAEMNDGLLAVAVLQKEEDRPHQVAIQ